MAWTRDLRRVADPPRLHAKELSHQMDTLILKSLEKDPSSRLAGFNEFVTALGRNPRARPSAAGIPVDFIRRHLARGAAGGGGGAGGGAGGAGAAGAR